jgi:hypothetical protein
MRARGEVKLPALGHSGEDLADLVSPRRSLLKICDRVMSASAPSPPCRVHLVERDEHVRAAQRRSAQVVSGVREELPVLRKPTLE